MKKIALCIGNAGYPEQPLKNPVNDATDIADRLRALGFECATEVDSTIERMESRLRTFRTELEHADIGLFFFAGHGMQIAGENYLTATNTNFESEIDAKYSSLALNKVIDVLESGSNDTSLIVLDACRDNPYERRWRGAASPGLAPVYAPKGTLISFATSPGETAFDGKGTNGAFTAALLQHIDSQNIPIEDLFKRIRNTLSVSTSGKQTSWEHTSLMGDFFFNTSLLGGDYVAEYSESAVADASFKAAPNSFVGGIIDRLGSCNWYTQNPAMDAIIDHSLEDANKNELFVLGRNIYQAACGTAATPMSCMDELHEFLQSKANEVAFHILNGMLFEVYFDSSGRFRRKNFKTQQLTELIRIEDSPDAASSFAFIRLALAPYGKQLFYMPGNGRPVLLDVELQVDGKNPPSVRRLVCEGQDVLYNRQGSTLIMDSSDTIYYHLERNKFEAEVREMMVIPEGRMLVTYSPNIDSDRILQVPTEYSLRRISE